MNDETFEELCVGHVLGALSEADEKLWAEALKNASASQLAFYRETAWSADHLSALEQEVPDAATSAKLKRQILEQIEPSSGHVPEAQGFLDSFRQLKRQSRYLLNLFLAALTLLGVLYGAQNCGSGHQKPPATHSSVKAPRNTGQRNTN